MSNSSDAAEQIVRMSLEGTQVALKLTGSAAKNIAAAIYAILKNRDKNKLKGRQRLTAMLKSGKELKVFTIGESDLKQFAAEARRYGVVYCALRNGKSSDGMVDVMVRAEDASKINRIVERFKLAALDTASIKHEIDKTRAEKDKGVQEKSDDDRLIDELLTKPKNREENMNENPLASRTERKSPSAPTSRKQEKAAEGSSKASRPSVREELREIQRSRQEDKPKPREEPKRNRPKTQRTQENKVPKRKRKDRAKRQYSR